MLSLTTSIVSGNFGVWGMTFATFDCTLIYLRNKEDHWNSIGAGALTGGILSMRSELERQLNTMRSQTSLKYDMMFACVIIFLYRANSPHKSGASSLLGNVLGYGTHSTPGLITKL